MMSDVPYVALVSWAKAGAIAWGVALLVVLLAEVRPIQRLIPDWLRNLSRVALLVGTIAILTAGGLVGARLIGEDLQARPASGPSVALELSFESPNAFFQSLYLSQHQEELVATGEDPAPVTFIVESGETATAVAQRLEELGLVVSGDVFRRYMSYEGLDASLQAGTYTLKATMTIPEVAEALQTGSVNALTVTIVEGWRAEQIGWLLEQRGLMSSDAFLSEVRSDQYDYAWLSGRPVGASLEGFLFPDTYEFAAEATPAEVVGRMLADFDLRAAAEIEAALTGRQLFDIATSAYRPLTAYDLVILASIVEREAVVPEERPIIASVYFNRLDPAYVNETALRLNSDPTVQYAKGYDAATGNWWNPMLPGEGLTVDSPYNTFRRQGLPPGPICNPGLASIEAVLQPAATTYLYFHAVGDGSHVFASTLEEHLKNQEKYQ
ncbi:MAG TPA: endolytic transglycosylase MltG [Anaerolineae bacterium]|nr:endolytic transglycosylase MltG [Anaerolineae bacterium]